MTSLPRIFFAASWRNILPAVVLAVALAACLPGRAAADHTPTIDEYLTQLRAAALAAQRSDRLGLETIAADLAEVREIHVNGASISVDNSWLDRALALTDPDFVAIADRLGATINALSQPESAAPGDALQRLDAILANPPYADQPEDAGWIGTLFDWIGRLIDSLFSQHGASISAGGRVGAWVFGSIGVLLLIGVIVYLLLGLRRTLVRDAAAEAADPEAHLTAQSALTQANDLARTGDHRTAMRYLYLSALLWLDERDLLRYDRALTNREYLERIGDNPALHARLAPVVETFDRVWYGHVPLDDAAFTAYKAQVEALRTEALR